MNTVYSNLYSQAVTHPSTNRSQPCLTSVIRRELVYSRWYGRRQCWSVRKSGHFNPLKSDSCCDHHSKLAYTTELTQDRSTLGVSKPGKCSPNLFLMICSYLQAATPPLTSPKPFLPLCYTLPTPLHGLYHVFTIPPSKLFLHATTHLAGKCKVYDHVIVLGSKQRLHGQV